MHTHRDLRTTSLRRLVVALPVIASCAPARSPAAGGAGGLAPPTPPGEQAPPPASRDGEHDFDFEIGTWKTSLSRLQRPLTGSQTWVKYEGTSVVREIWNGRANMVELVVEGPAGRIEGLSLRLYDAETHQWNLHYARAGSGEISPPMVGAFAGGRGEFFSRETFDGRPILVRFVISDITETSCRFEQAFSADDGKTWEVNWIAIDTRVDGDAGAH